MTCSLPEIALQAVVFGLPIYYGCALRSEGRAVLNFLALSVVISFIIHGLAWMSISVSRVYAVAALVSNMSFTFIGLTSGEMINFTERNRNAPDLELLIYTSA